MALDSRIRRLLRPFLIDYLGFADLRRYGPDLAESGGALVEGYPLGVSIGIAIPDAVVDRLPERDDPIVSGAYRSHGYEVLNARLNSAASLVASFLGSRGHRALPIPAADITDKAMVRGIVSHKMIAHVAGLGWIGKNCLLVTPDRGPRVRFVSVLTDAPLAARDEPMEQRCGACAACVSICPTASIKGRNYVSGEGRELRLDFRRCDAYFKELEATRPYPVCGLCLYACPYGRRGARGA